MEPLTLAGIEWASASRPALAGEVCGDACCVIAGGDASRIAVIDGVGHGPPAAAAAAAAMRLLSADPGAHPALALARCHEGLRHTRGVALGLASLDAVAGMLTWIGVGDVAGLLVRAGGHPRRDVLTGHPGVVGRRVPEGRVRVLAVRPGDTLVLATDGVDRRFTGSFVPDGSPQGAADRLLAGHATGRDDALVLVARVRGGP
jgi:negative regulator of sigma-B (phosphoserine phosphatase)